jgi:hypothetical protein
MSSPGAIVAAGYWETQAGAATSAPGPGKYQADDWATPALLGIAGTDADGYSRQAGLAQLRPGDAIYQLAPNDSQNVLQLAVVSVTDQGTWVQYAVTVTATGATFVPPGTNQSRLLEALQQAGAQPPMAWQPWAPPLDPPTAGGLPADVAAGIADAWWSADPHMAAALQWEAYAAMLPPSPSVSNVSTGVQSVAYSPPVPGGDYGLAISRAAWHRSLAGSAASAPLTLADPAIETVPQYWPPRLWEVSG